MTTYSGEPKRPKSHQIGDMAKHQVMDLFSSQGWINNPVTTDYGDDLHIQITEGEHLIPVRIYAQIKGTENIQKFSDGEHYKIPNLKRSSVIHWLNSDEISVIILWDVRTGSGVYGFVNEIFADFNQDEKMKHMTAVLSNKNTLDKKFIRSFKIMAISTACNQRHKVFSGMLSLIEHKKDAEETYGIKKSVIVSQITDNILFYLTSIGVLQADSKNNKFGLSKRFHEKVAIELAKLIADKRFKKQFTEQRVNELFDMALIMALIVWRYEKFNHASPTALVEGCFKIIPIYYKEHIEMAKQILKQEN